MHAGQVGSLNTWLDDMAGRHASRCSLGDAARCYNASPLQRGESGPVLVLPAVDLCVLPSLTALSFGDLNTSGLCSEAAPSSRHEQGLKSRAVDALLFGISDSDEDGDDDGDQEGDEILSVYGRPGGPCAASFNSCAVLGTLPHDEDSNLDLVPTSVSGRCSSLKARRTRGIVSSTGYVLAPTSAAEPFISSPSSSAHSSSSDCASGTVHGSLGLTLSASGMSTSTCVFTSAASASSSGGGAGDGAGEGYCGLRLAGQQDQQEGVSSFDSPRTAATSTWDCGATSNRGSSGSSSCVLTAAAAAAAAFSGAAVPACGSQGDSPSAAWLSRTDAARASSHDTRPSSAAVLWASPVSFAAFMPLGCADGDTPQQAAACGWPRLSEEGMQRSCCYNDRSSPVPTASAGATAVASSFAPADTAAGCRTSAKSNGPYEGTVRGGNPRCAGGRASPLSASLAAASDTGAARSLGCTSLGCTSLGCTSLGCTRATAAKRSAPIPVAARPPSPHLTQQRMQQQAMAAPAAPCLAASPPQVRGVAPRHLCDMLRHALQRRP